MKAKLAFATQARRSGLAVSGILLLMTVMTVTAQPVVVNLPPGPVTANLAYPQTETPPTYTSFFDVQITGAPSGFDVLNQHYLGWCADQFASFQPSRSYILYNTYGSLPSNAFSVNWPSVNWLLNNKPFLGTATWQQQNATEIVQQVIWRLLNGQYASGYPLHQPDADNLYGAAIGHSGFVPAPGQTLAVLMYVDGLQNASSNTVQDNILELKVPTRTCAGAIGDFVWNDMNNNGIQDSGEPGINGVTVTLRDQSGNLLASTVTTNAPAGYPFLPSNSAGYYQFKGLCPATYHVAIDNGQPALVGLTPSAPYTGNFAVDSNGNPETVTLLNSNSVDETIDFGYHSPCTIPSSAEVISPTSWNKFSAPGGSVVWVHAQYNPKGVSTTSTSVVRFTNVSFVLNGRSYPMPNGVMTFNPSAPTVSTTHFNAALNQWETLVNPNNLSDENFMTGAAIPVDSNITGGGQATIVFTTATNDTGLNFPWQWSAAVFTYWPSDWNQAGIQPYHGNGPTGSQHADTPTNTQVQHSLIQGPRGGGGSNFTGSWSATGHGTCP